MRAIHSPCFPPLLIVALAAGLAASGAAQDGEPAPITGETRVTPLRLEDVVAPRLRADLEGFAPTDGPETFPWTMQPPRPGAPPAQSLTFPSPRPSGVPANDRVTGRFRPAEGLPPGERAPAAIILHHLSGAGELESLISGYLAGSGIQALEIDLPYYGPRRPAEGDAPRLLEGDPEQAVTIVRQSVADVRRALDWLLDREDVDPDRTGVVGISLGAVLGALVCGVDPRARCDVLALGGGDLPAILTGDALQARRARESAGSPPPDLEELAARLEPIEPLRFAHRIDGAGLLMINARQDELIPDACTRSLWEAAGRPEILWYDTGHATIATHLLEILPRVRDHFLDPPAPRRTEFFSRTRPRRGRKVDHRGRQPARRR